MAARWVHQTAWFLRLALPLSVVLWGGTVASAGCGDHARAVFVSIETGSQVVNPGQFSNDLATTPFPTDVPRPPCTGPSCSRQPAAPMAIPMPDRPPTDHGLDSLRAIAPHSLDERPFIAGPRAEYASPAAGPLDRPPRP